MFIEILFKMLLFKGGVLIYAEHCTYTISVFYVGYIIIIIIMICNLLKLICRLYKYNVD